MQTVIYIADTAPLQNDVLFAALYQTLPDYRRRTMRLSSVNREKGILKMSGMFFSICPIPESGPCA